MRRSRLTQTLALVALMTGANATKALAQTVPSETADCVAIPANMIVDRAIAPMVMRAISEVETIRRQCGLIASASHLRVSIRLHPGRLIGGTRAQATITRYAFGAIRVEITLPVTSRHIEMLAHELEHVIEQLEGARLHELVGQRHSGVRRFADGAFETRRAEQAGRAAEREVENATGTTGTSRYGDSQSKKVGPRRRFQSGTRRTFVPSYPSYLSYPTVLRRESAVDRKRLPGPRAHRRPWLSRRGPELVRRRQTEGEQTGRAEIEAAGRDVGLADPRLVATEANAQPPVGVEGARCVHRPANHRGQGAANLRGDTPSGNVRLSAICASS